MPRPLEPRLPGSFYPSEAGTVRAEKLSTAICVEASGELVARTRKIHIPSFPGYHEDRYFAPGDTGFPVFEAGSKFGFPTCWDQWFPELARIYALQGAEILVYPTAIGSEPHLEQDFDTQPLWERLIVANGIANATFMVVINRIGLEEPLGLWLWLWLVLRLLIHLGSVRPGAGPGAP